MCNDLSGRPSYLITLLDCENSRLGILLDLLRDWISSEVCLELRLENEAWWDLFICANGSSGMALLDYLLEVRSCLRDYERSVFLKDGSFISDLYSELPHEASTYYVTC